MAFRPALIGFFVVLAPQLSEAKDITPNELVKAAKTAEISQNDHSLAHCKDRRQVQDWLKEVLGDTARSVRWAGGRCVLAIKQRARDAGTKWCAHAVIAPHRGEAAVVEIYLDKPVKGRPGSPFAFRASVETKGGRDYVRETWAFEAGWKEAHVPGYTSSGFPGCQ